MPLEAASPQLECLGSGVLCEGGVRSDELAGGLALFHLLLDRGQRASPFRDRHTEVSARCGALFGRYALAQPASVCQDDGPSGLGTPNGTGGF